MRVKTVTKKARELKQGDTLEATGQIVHSAVTDRRTNALGHSYRTRITVAGGDYLDTDADRELVVVAKLQPKQPYFKYTFLELMLFNMFTFTATSMIWMAYINKWFGVSINVMP
jgi:hypothetical protein